jgi:hypothetical protein
MVEVGLTDLVPDKPTAPMLWLIETLVAFVLDQVSVDAAPAVMEAGEALIVTVGRLGAVPSTTSCLISFIFCTPSQPFRPYPS